MNLQEALDKYSIAVPTDEEFYSKEYNEYFSEGNPEYRERFEKYRDFNEMYAKSFYITFYSSNQNKGDRTINNSHAVVLGGQAGAGKSSLVSVAKEEAHNRGMEIFLIDDDQYRQFYPRTEEILKECPEYYTKISAIGSGTITPKIMKYASDNGLNFIFDGTMKNARILNTAKQWNNYTINWKIMATSKIESLLSVFERNEFLRHRNNGRFMTTKVHDETYDGLEETLKQLEGIENFGTIQVYSRGKDIGHPVLKYDSSRPSQYESAVEALRSTRESDRKRCIKNGVAERISNLYNTDIPWNPTELAALKELEEDVHKEVECRE